MQRIICALILSWLGAGGSSLAAGPTYLEDRFEIPEGFRIYKVADRSLCGGSYDITFDGSGRLLVGDGKQVRRLIDRDDDGIYDHFEVIARGLGGRGPQGLLVHGDRLYAVGGDGIQLYEGYRSATGPLEHRGRIGAPFHTGGDHAAHTIFRGHDDHLYFITGNGGGAGGRKHITEESSPARFEREGSVFRISPDGERWECIGTGARNAPNLGMNYLGELFSLDSDMEWHVDLPWWRPVRLNHWVTGGDQGWQGVGAYPPYYIDGLPGIHDVGRGSPDWGVFYEHEQFPERYRDAYFVCDYRSKSATTGGYATAGRLFVFFLERRGAVWDASMEVFAIPAPGARDGDGRPIDFALVDVEVGPDGSLYLSDHGQGVWRIHHDPGLVRSAGGPPPIVPRENPLPREPEHLIDELLSLPQPMAEGSRLRREKIRAALGVAYASRLRVIASDTSEGLRRRLRAVRCLAARFPEIPGTFLLALAEDPFAELRAQAAWLMGLRKNRKEATFLATRLVDDPDPFVRRRALEALTRNRPVPEELSGVIRRLNDSERIVRYTAMIALSHHPTRLWFERAVSEAPSRCRMRALVAADLREERPSADRVRREVRGLQGTVGAGSPPEDRLDLLRILGRFRDLLAADAATRRAVGKHLLSDFPSRDARVRWEQTRLIGEYRFTEGFPEVLTELLGEKDHVTQFHIARALARLPGGWDDAEEKRAVDWFLQVQEGWFARFAGKGLQFRQFWATVLSEFVGHHERAFLARLERLELGGQLGGVVLDRAAGSPDGADLLIRLYRTRQGGEARHRVLRALGRVRSREVSGFLREEFNSLEGEHQAVALVSLARQPPFQENRPFLEEGLFHEDIDVFRACAQALSRDPGDSQEDICQLVLSRMVERREAFRAGERLLVAWSGERRSGYNPDADIRRNPRDRERNAGLEHWKAWYRKTFDTEFTPLTAELAEERSNEELRDFILSEESRGGSVRRGSKIYVQLCGRCHGGAVKRAKDVVIFGPDLTGVTRRLSREEFADSLVFPSRLVAERFKGVTVQLRAGEILSGFVTEKNDRKVVLVAQEQVHRLDREKILSMAPQEKSLMPDGQLNRLTGDDLRDLLAFVEEVGSRPEPEKKQVKKGQK